MASSPRSPVDQRWLWAWCFAVVLTLAFGTVGFARYEGEPTAGSLLNSFYLALQLFVLESAHLERQIPLELHAARFLAPTLLGWAAIAALLGLLRDQVALFRLRWTRDHIVICGLGRWSLPLIRELRQEGEPVVVIDDDPDNALLGACRATGATALIGDATQPAVLEQAGLLRARRFVALCPRDRTNVEIAVRAARLLRDRLPASADFPEVLVHVADSSLAAQLHRGQAFPVGGDRPRLRVVNTFRNGARQLFDAHPLDHDHIGASDSRGVHLVVIGFGKMGQAVALQAAEIGHFANFESRRLKLTVIDREASKRMREFDLRHPHFDEVCEVELLDKEAEGPETLKLLVEWSEEEKSITTIAACLGDESKDLSIALSLLDRCPGIRSQVAVRMESHSGLAALLEGHAPTSALGLHVHVFGTIEASCSREFLFGDRLDRLARAIHDDFIATNGGYDASNPARRPWEDLSEGFKDSNRYQADHMWAKLRAIRCKREAGLGARPIDHLEAAAGPGETESELELLARMEHQRWNVERILAGWKFDPASDRDKKKTPYLVSWKDLPEKIKDYDRRAVSIIPRLLESIGEKAYR